MVTRQIIEDSLGSNDPGRIREILQNYFHEIEDVLPDLLGSTLHDDIVPDSARQLAGELYAVTIKALFGDHLYATRLLQEIPPHAHTVSMQQLKRAYRERQVTQLCRDLCYFSSGNDYLRELVSRTLPNVRKLYDLSYAITDGRKNRWDQTDCGINKLTGLVVSFSILYRALHDKPELTDVEVEALQYAETKISLQLGNRSPNDPCEIALNRLKGDIRFAMSRNTNVEYSTDDSVSEYSSYSIWSADSEESESEAVAMTPAWIGSDRAAVLSVYRRLASDSSFPARYFYAWLICPSLMSCFTVLSTFVEILCAFVISKRFEGVVIGLAKELLCAFVISKRFEGVVIGLAKELMIVATLGFLHAITFVFGRVVRYVDLNTKSWFSRAVRLSLYPPRVLHDECVIPDNRPSLVDLGYTLGEVIVKLIGTPFSILISVLIHLIHILSILIFQSCALVQFMVSAVGFIVHLVIDNLGTRIKDLHRVFSALSQQQTANLSSIRESVSFIGFTAQVNCHIVNNCIIRILEAIVRPFLLALRIFAPRTATGVVSAIESHMFVDDTFTSLPAPNEILSTALGDDHPTESYYWRPIF
tara:strand:+ start:1415 stop:3178 length:1764 start_codon:yes stop_codon:yes gene_type:complete